jgi:hypothetical protein
VGSKEAKLGKDFENDIQAALDKLARIKPISYVRLYDSKSARGKFLPEQPADFIIASPTGGHLLEAKASREYTSLRSCLSDHVSTGQAAGHRLWAMTGQPCWFVFYSVTTEEVEWWRGEIVGAARAKGVVLPKEGEDDGPIVISKDSLEDLLYCALTKSKRINDYDTTIYRPPPGVEPGS